MTAPVEPTPQEALEVYPLQPWVQLLLTFLGGGLLSSLITSWRSNRAEQLARRTTYLETQLQKVYGPVYLRMLEVKRLIQLYNHYGKAWEQLGIEWDSLERDSGEYGVLQRDWEATYELARNVLGLIHEINRATLLVVEQNVPHVDVEDMRIVLDLFEDVTRHQLEMDGAPDVSKITNHASSKLPTNHILREDVFARVEQRYLEKKAELTRLTAISGKTRTIS